MVFYDWMISCGHQIRCAIHDRSRSNRECDCSALRGAEARPGVPVCALPHPEEQTDV